MLHWNKTLNLNPKSNRNGSQKEEPGAKLDIKLSNNGINLPGPLGDSGTNVHTQNAAKMEPKGTRMESKGIGTAPKKQNVTKIEPMWKPKAPENMIITNFELP